ncbi:MAG: PQQ-dependent sugar dehydrogenase [Balneolaceae bacterium]|nr:PQQ-dependent sugar dehydrogenase [Balneolaceae bacterium]MCH8549391.1 PQQ-dependent sugar dehydrogenase [Balneolaceae bacterium]
MTNSTAGYRFRSSAAVLAVSGLFFLILLSTCSDNPVFSGDEAPEVTYGTLHSFSHEVVTDGLQLPWQMAFLPDGRLLITERGGVVRLFEDGSLQEEPWLDLRDLLKNSRGETVSNSGLLGIAADPSFSENGFFYVGYSYESPHSGFDYNRLVRYKEDSVSGNVEVSKVLLDKVKGKTMHNTGQIKFGPDGKIYWSAGDRHQIEVAQDHSDPSGSILRINPDGSIPETNPFSDSPVYAYGLRNSQGFDWHPKTGTMLATEHGPSGGTGRSCCYDEINRIEPGKNYGWPHIVGDEKRSGMENPIIHSSTGTPVEKYTWAPSGATFVKSGPWADTFLFAGLRSESLWMLRLDGEERPMELNRMLEEEYGRLRSVEQGPDGAIYVITSNRDNYENRAGVRYESDLLIRIVPEVN